MVPKIPPTEQTTNASKKLKPNNMADGTPAIPSLTALAKKTPIISPQLRSIMIIVFLRKLNHLRRPVLERCMNEQLIPHQLHLTK